MLAKILLVLFAVSAVVLLAILIERQHQTPMQTSINFIGGLRNGLPRFGGVDSRLDMGVPIAGNFKLF